MTAATLQSQPDDRPPSSKKPPRFLLYSFIAVAVFLVLLPLGIRIGAEFALKKFGAETANISNVDLNLFTGTFAIEGVQVTYQQQPTLSLDKLSLNISLLALFKKQLLVESLTVSGLYLAIYQQDEQWVIGLPLPAADTTNNTADKTEEASAASEWVVGIEQLAFDNIAIHAHYQAKEHTLQLDNLALNDIFMWQPKNLSKFTIEGSIDEAPLRLSSQLMPFADAPQFQLHIQLDDLKLAALQSFLPEDITALAASLSINTELQLALSPSGDIALTQDGQLGIKLDDVSMADISLSAKDIIWQGKVTVAIAKDQQPVINTDGGIRIQQLNAQYIPLLINTHFAQLQWQGQTQTDLHAIDQSLQVNGQFSMDDWHVFDQQIAADLANFEQLQLEDISLSGLADIQLSRIQLTKLEALQAADSAVLKLGDITLNNIAFTQLQQLVIDEMTLANIQLQLSRNSNGNIDIVDEWLASLDQRMLQQKTASNAAPQSSNTASESTEAEADEKTPFNYKIGAIHFSGDNPITFTDKGISPAVRHTASIKKLALGTIDSQHTAQLTPLDIQLQLYRHGSFSVTGDVTPLADINAISGQLNAAVKGIDLTDISPYIEQSIGYNAKSGQFNSDTQATIKQGQLDSETKIRILRIDLQPADEELIAKASTSLAMPVSTALKVITDGDNNLKLTVPVKGDLSNPNVKINKIMTAAITQAVKNSAMTYFKYAVQPFGAILLVSQAINDKVLQARFEDVRFTPGTADIVSAQKGYLEKVAQMIKDKKDFSIIACVVVTEEDFLARSKPLVLDAGEEYTWDEESQVLAADRLEFIRSNLIQQHGLSSEQIQSCKPSLGKGIPRAVMGI